MSLEQLHVNNGSVFWNIGFLDHLKSLLVYGILIIICLCQSNYMWDHCVYVDFDAILRFGHLKFLYVGLM